jgi:hypothetical protein
MDTFHNRDIAASKAEQFIHEAPAQQDDSLPSGDLRRLSSSSYSELVLYSSDHGDQTQELTSKVPENPLRWANYYTNLGNVVVGGSSNFSTHTKTHEGLKTWQRSQGEILVEHDLNALEDNKIDGYLDGINYIVRIENHKDLMLAYASAKGEQREALKSELDIVLDRYRIAIDIASKAAHERGGKVVLQAEEDRPGEVSYPIMICKMLGRLHQASAQSTMFAETFIKKSIQKTDAGECFYSKTTGKRYFFPEQYLALLDRIENRDDFLKGLTELDELLSTKNLHGARNAQFFVVDKQSNQVVNTESSLRKWSEYIQDFRETCESYRGNWANNIGRIRSGLEEIAELHYAETDPKFAHINYNDPDFLSVISGLLRVGCTDLALGGGISTPLLAVENGFFDQTKNHEFVHTGAESIHEHITSWALKQFPEAQTADWLCICEPQIPLTFDHHPSQTVNDIGDLPQKSYVVLFGKIGEEERRIVIRENIYAPHRWKERQTDKVKELLTSYTPEALSQWAQDFRVFQYYLSDKLVSATGAMQAAVAEAFKPVTIGDSGEKDNFEYREFVNGGRADLQQTSSWSYEKFKALLRCVGKVFAVALVEQIPDLSLSDIVISHSSSDGLPEKITLLSATETFCHSLGIKSLDKYMRVIPTLYANHLARWVEAYCSAGHGASLSQQDRKEHREQLIATCLDAMKKGLHNIARRGHEEFLQAADEAESHFTPRVNGSVRPPETLDMTRYLKLSKQLATLKPEQIEMIIEDIRHAALQNAERLQQLIQSGNSNPDDKLSPIQIDEFLTAACSLVGNHFSDAKRFPMISAIFHGTAINMSSYTLKEKTWIFTLIDVGARLSELGGDERRPAIIEAAVVSSNFEEFYERTQDPAVSLNLPKRTLEMFFESFQGLINAYRSLEGGDLKKAQIKKDLKQAFALRGVFNS